MSEYNEMQSLTLNGTKYDSFPDQKAREGIKYLENQATILYTTQELTAEQQAQARGNIDAQERTHWDGRTFTEIMPETTFEGSIAIITEPIPQIPLGEYGNGTFRVVLDGLTYDVVFEYVARDDYQQEIGYIKVAVAGMPFYIHGYYDYDANNSAGVYCNVLIIPAGDASAEHTVAVYVPEGELVTLPEKFLPPSVQSPLVVTVTETTEDGENYVYTADYTEQQIVDAHESGRVVMCKLIRVDGPETLLALTAASQLALDDEGTEVYPFAIFGSVCEGFSYEVVLVVGEVMAQSTDITPPTRLPNPKLMDINGVVYNGEEYVSYTATINAMIDAKIPAVPTKTSELTNDSGYLTSAPVTSVNGQTGAVSLDIPTVPTALPNPKALTIDGTAYDGSKAVTMYTGGGTSVLAYGAKGDGATDDTAAFQAALAANRVVRVPGGTYLLNGTLTIGANCQLELSQDTVLRFQQTSANCIEMKRSAWIKGNHATIFVPQEYTGHVIHASTDVDDASASGSDNNSLVPPWTMWDPQWKTARYVTDVNICKTNASGLNYSAAGEVGGTAVYINCDNADATRYMWGVNMSGLRIAGAFTHGVHIINEDGNGSGSYAWNHELRLEAVIDACEIGVEVDHCDNGYISAVIQPRAAVDGTVYAKHGIKLSSSKNVDLSGSRVWDWNANNTLWTDGGEYQHMAFYGQCRGAIVSTMQYYEQSAIDIRKLIHTDTASNLEQMTILQEPVTRWFKPVDGVPYFNNGETERRVLLDEDLEEYFKVTRVANFTDALALATDGDGNIYNDVGYKKGAYFNAAGTEYSSGYPYYVSTGFIPAVVGDVIRTKDISFDFALTAASGSPDGSMKIAYYDASKKILGIQTCGNVMNTAGYYQSGERTDDGLKITLNGGLVEFGTVAYVRFVFHIYDFGENPVISVNAEIKYNQEGFLADGIRVSGDNVLLASPGGKTYKLVVDENGGLSTVLYE